MTDSQSRTAPNYEEDYQLWDARDREDTRKGKGFVVRMINVNVMYP